MIASLALQAGCVDRRLTVRTNPPGAQLFVDDYEIGTTPVSTDFTYYGTRQIRLIKDGYETLVIKQPIPAPWYQYFPVDFVTENLVPGQIRDERVVTYQLQPSIQVPNEQLVGRAQALRENGRAGALANAAARGPQPLGAAIPGYAPPPNVVPSAEPVSPGNVLPPPTNSLPPGAAQPPAGYSVPPGYAAPAPTYPSAVPAPYSQPASGRPFQPLP